MPNVNKNHLEISEGINASILPANKMEILRDVTLKTGFNIHGALYANNLYAEGSGIVDGAVFAKNEILLSPPSGEDERMIFRRGINSGKAVMVNVSDLKRSSPVRECDCTPLVIRGDICSGNVKLDNALVLGNIHCEEAFIKESIIIGSPFVSRTLQIENSVMISFNAGTVLVRGRNALWIPYGVARTSINFVNDDTLASIRYIGLCGSDSGCNDARIACAKYLDGKCEYDDVLVKEEDIMDIKQADGQYCKVLSIAPKLVDIATIDNIIGNITDFVIDVTLFDHFDDSSKKEMLEGFNQDHNILIDQLTKIALP